MELPLAGDGVQRLRGAPVALDLAAAARAHHRLDAPRPARARALRRADLMYKFIHHLYYLLVHTWTVYSIQSSNSVYGFI